MRFNRLLVTYTLLYIEDSKHYERTENIDSGVGGACSPGGG